MEKIKGKVKQLNKNSITVVASSRAVDRDGDVLDPNGWDLKNFQTNPVLLWSHNASELPIGKVLDVHTEGDELVAEVKFADHDFATTVEKLVRDGFINTTSVGFIPQEVDVKDALSSKQELLELSFVNVPSNPTALVSREYKEFQNKVKEFEAKIEDEKEIKVEEKSGRVISEKNRNIIRIAKEALSEVLELSETEPKKDEITEPDKKGVIIEKVKGNKPTKGLRLAKMMDKIAEAMIANEKEQGVKKK